MTIHLSAVEIVDLDFVTSTKLQEKTVFSYNRASRLREAKRWAGKTLIRDEVQPPIGNCDAAAEVISSLPAVIVDGDELRKLIKEWRTDCPGEEAKMVLDQVEALIPTPPTLAGMDARERNECLWMQASVVDEEDVMTGVIQSLNGNHAWVMFRNGNRNSYKLHEVTPRSDLPKMVWPSSELEDAE